jgi:predicted esterase
MKTEEHNIIISKHARYSTLGSPSVKIKSVWFVLHGYGYLASEFINNFDAINNGENYIIVPEALNKFYLKGFYGKVGATWMTKEDRKNEISDYINFLNSVYETEINKFDKTKIKINVLGFSQGCPTAVRWLVSGKCTSNSLTLWSGEFPHDSDPEKIKSALENVKINFVIGESDKIIDEKRVKEEIKKIEKLELNLKIHKFKGGHEINKTALLEIVSELDVSN